MLKYMYTYWHLGKINLNLYSTTSYGWNIPALQLHNTIASPETYLTALNHSAWDEIKQEVAPDSISLWLYIC